MLDQINKTASSGIIKHHIRHSKKAQLLESALKPKNGIFSIPPAFHDQYTQFYNESFLTSMRITAFLGPILFASIGLIDWFFLHEPTVVTFIRFALVEPCLILIALFSLSRFFIKLEQPLMIAETIIITLGVLSIIYYVPLENKYFHLATLLLIQILLFTLARIRFWYGVILIFFIWLGANVVLRSLAAPLEFTIERNYLFLTTSLLAIFTGFMMEQTNRQTFLQKTLLEYEKRYLSYANKRLQSIATLDSLTKIYNRRYFVSSLAKEWNRAARFNYPLALLMMDINNFKQINDTHGHLCGDQCLQQFGATLKNIIQRPGDLVARYGGDEFAVLLIATERANAEKIGSLIQQITDKLIIYSEEGKLIRIQVSIGIGVIYPSAENKPKQLIVEADKNLFVAKKKVHLSRTP